MTSTHTRVPDRAEVEALFELPEGDLLERIAIAEFPGLGGSSRDRRSRLGDHWWDGHYKSIKETVCANERIQKLLAADTDLIDVVTLSVPVVLVALPELVSAISVTCALIILFRMYGRGLCDAK
ncbi:hypothetical protein AB0B04_33245 [Streptomyces xinghaiensis]